MMAGLTWLHLSDWHQKGEDFDCDVVRETLIKDIKTRTHIHKDLKKIDFIVFSGDVTFNGKKAAYDAAVKYLFTPLLEVTGLDASRLFLVPGNHDLDRQIATLFREQILKCFTSDEIIKECLSKKAEQEILSKPFEAYENFAKPYAEGNLSAYASYYSFTVGDKKIALLGFNSALLSGRGDTDYGNLFIGEYQVSKPLEKAKAEADVRIAVLHHPLEYLTAEDQSTMESRLKKGVHFILHGHPHKGSVTIQRIPVGDCMIVPAGATYHRHIDANPNYISSYNFMHLDFETGNGQAYLRKWDETSGCWTKHIRDIHPEGIFAFPIPK